MMNKQTLLLAFVALLGSCEAASRYLSLSKTMGSSRIINGEGTTTAEYPHQASLRQLGSHRCGASIISNEYALTAAHCVDGTWAILLTVVVNVGTPSPITFNVDSVIMHEGYSSTLAGYPNDVTILKLNTAGKPNIAANIIPVAAGKGEDFADQTCVITGWVNGNSQTTNVIVLSNADCSNSNWGTNIQDLHICVKGYATEPSTGACNGDSGGSLVCKHNGMEVLAGVASLSISSCHGNGNVNHPSLYARTLFFNEWIQQNCNYCF